MSKDAYIHKVLPGSPGGPLLFVFHGTGADENQLLSLARDLAPQATIISPRGDVSEQGAARFFRRTGEGVYDMADLDKPSSVLGLGYSNGANILASVVFAAPERFDATVLMHPLIPFEPDVKGSLSGRRVLLTAGKRDPICPPTLTSRLEAYLRADGADVTVAWHEGGHEARPNEIEAARRFFAGAPVEGA